MVFKIQGLFVYSAYIVCAFVLPSSKWDLMNHIIVWWLESWIQPFEQIAQENCRFFVFINSDFVFFFFPFAFFKMKKKQQQQQMNSPTNGMNALAFGIQNNSIQNRFEIMLTSRHFQDFGLQWERLRFEFDIVIPFNKDKCNLLCNALFTSIPGPKIKQKKKKTEKRKIQEKNEEEQPWAMRMTAHKSAKSKQNILYFINHNFLHMYMENEKTNTTKSSFTLLYSHCVSLFVGWLLFSFFPVFTDLTRQIGMERNKKKFHKITHMNSDRK